MIQKIIRYISILLLTIAFGSCNYFKNVKLLIKPKMERSNFVQAVPFEWRKDLIVVKARINNDTTWREFIFDTGAFNSKVESNLAESLNLPVVTEKMNSTAQGVTRKIQVLVMDSIQLGDTKFYNIGAGKVNYDATSASPCVAGDGIIGANLIKLAHWKIDYQNKMLYFSDKPIEENRELSALSFKRPLLSGTPTISLHIENKEIKDVLFDVGYNGGLILPLSYADYFDSNESFIVLDKATSGIYGTNIDSIIVKRLKVNIGGTIADMPVEFSALNKTLLGNEILKHFNVYIDYDKKEIHFDKQKDIYISNPGRFLVGILNDTSWVVNRTNPKLDLSLGDTLLSVNGKKPKDLFDSYCDYILNISKLLDSDSLIIQRKDGNYTVLKENI